MSLLLRDPGSFHLSDLWSQDMSLISQPNKAFQPSDPYLKQLDGGIGKREAKGIVELSTEEGSRSRFTTLSSTLIIKNLVIVPHQEGNAVFILLCPVKNSPSLGDNRYQGTSGHSCHTMYERSLRVCFFFYLERE